MILLRNRMLELTSKSSILNMFHGDSSLRIGKNWGNESSNASRAKGQVRIDNSNISKCYIQNILYRISILSKYYIIEIIWYNLCHRLDFARYRERKKSVRITYRKKCNLIRLCRTRLLKFLKVQLLIELALML